MASVDLPLQELGCGSKQINSVDNEFRVSISQELITGDWCQRHIFLIRILISLCCNDKTTKILKAKKNATYKSVCCIYVYRMQVLFASDSKIQIRSTILYGIYLVVNHRFIGSLQCFIQDEATAAFNTWHENLWLKITVHKYFQSKSENF